MSDWFKYYSNLMAVVVMMAMASHIDSMARAIIGPKLERRLGRPLTEWDWQYYWQEVTARARVEARNRYWNALQQHFADREIIRDFAWEE